MTSVPAAPAEGADLGREFLHALIGAADGDRFLRGGHLHAETLLLLAIKTYDYESHHAGSGRRPIIIDGRSLDTTAVYQSVLMYPGDDGGTGASPPYPAPGRAMAPPARPHHPHLRRRRNSHSTAPASATSGRSHPRSGSSNCAPTASTGS